MANAPWYVGSKFGGFGEAPPAETQPRRGMFGGRNWGGTIADFLTNFSAGMGNPAAMATMQARFQQQQEMGQARTREQERQQGLADHWTEFQREQEYRLSHPAPPEPTELERYMRAAGIDPNSEQGRRLFTDAATNRANPVQGVPYTDEQGRQGIQFIRPNTLPQAPAVLNELPPNAVPIPAGGAASGPRPFR